MSKKYHIIYVNGLDDNYKDERYHFFKRFDKYQNLGYEMCSLITIENEDRYIRYSVIMRKLINPFYKFKQHGKSTHKKSKSSS